MPGVVVVGSQWGDEGKGKITNYLAQEADVVVRYQGGPNAGHTVVIGEKELQLHLLPSGIIYPDKLSIIGNGVVVDPEVMIAELEGLWRDGVDTRGLRISDKAHLIMPYHRVLDVLQEEGLGAHKLGTTLKGVGPAYMDKSARVGIRVGDLLDPPYFKERTLSAAKDKNRIFTRFYGREPMDPEPMIDTYLAIGHRLKEYITDTPPLVNQAISQGQRVLFEGAQGTLLDLDHGTYPYVTSSHPVSGGASIGAGVGPNRIADVVGVVKAYTSRVGDGPFPTELADEKGDYIREVGHEYGVTTGRPRRIGWLDLVMVRYSAMLSGFTSLALTRLDTLSGIDPIRVAYAYRYKGEMHSQFPSRLSVLRACEPVYRDFPGWPAVDPSSKRREDLHPHLRNYLDFIESQTGVPLSSVSIGRERSETLSFIDVFA